MNLTNTQPTESPVPPKIAESSSRQPNSQPISKTYTLNIHFQPDLPYPTTTTNPDGTQTQTTTTVISSLAQTQQYHSQFHTGISNGGLLATSARADWEVSLFGDFYSSPCPSSTSASVQTQQERPKYGALNLTADLYGACPRFGSSYLRLKPHVLARCTFCYPDSFFFSLGRDVALGTAAHFSHVEKVAMSERDEVRAQDPLNWYVETHVHGPLVVPLDAEAVVLDPCYKGTEVESAARRLGCRVEWHGGYRVEEGDIDWARWERYREEDTVMVARRLVDWMREKEGLAKGEGWLDPAVLGRAYGNSELGFAQQQIKRVWHCLARFGGREKSGWPA